MLFAIRFFSILLNVVVGQGREFRKRGNIFEFNIFEIIVGCIVATFSI